MLYMPFAHTDFIFPMIGEEMGLLVTFLVVLAFITLIVAGFVIAFHAPDRFGSLDTHIVVHYVILCRMAFSIQCHKMPFYGIL